MFGGQSVSEAVGRLERPAQQTTSGCPACRGCTSSSSASSSPGWRSTAGFAPALGARTRSEGSTPARTSTGARRGYENDAYKQGDPHQTEDDSRNRHATPALPWVATDLAKGNEAEYQSEQVHAKET